MHCLFHDNSFGTGVFALFCGEEVLEEKCLGQLETRQPVRVFQDLLTKRNLSLDDIEYVACGVGPGSYTGIRSACATVRGISFCTKKKIVAIPSLLLFVPETVGRYVIVVEAGISGAYCQRVFFDGTRYDYEAPVALQVEEIEAFSRQEVIVSPTAAWLLQKGIIVREAVRNVNGVARIAAECYKKGIVYDAQTVQPIYLRKTQAEIEKSEKILSKRS